MRARDEEVGGRGVFFEPDLAHGFEEFLAVELEKVLLAVAAFHEVGSLASWGVACVPPGDVVGFVAEHVVSER